MAESSRIVSDVCAELKAMGAALKAHSTDINFNAMNTIRDSVVVGEGLLPDRKRDSLKQKNYEETDGSGSEFELEQEEDDEMEPVKRPREEPLDEDELQTFLNNLNDDIVRDSRKETASYHPFGILLTNKQKAQQSCAPLKIDGMKRKAFEHQLKAAAMIVKCQSSKLKGMIIADPMGMGKTATALMAIRHHIINQTYGGPCVVIAPASCVRQWMAETRKWFSKVIDT